MLKILKYYKPFIGSIIFIIVLLFIQAICDLNLPNYMADIVNIGVQGNGIESPTPEAISQNGFILITTFMNDEGKKLFNENYIKINEKSNIDKEKINKLNISLKNNEYIYFLKDVNSETLEKMNINFSLSIRTFLNIVKEVSNTNSTINKEKNFNNENINFSKIYEMLPILEKIPKEKIKLARSDAEEVELSMLTQIAKVFTKELYDEVGINTSKIQMKYIIIIGAKMIGITVIGAIATIIVGYLGSKVAAGVSKILRKKIFKKVEGFTNKEFDKFSTASLITRTTNDINQIQIATVMGIRMLFYAPIIGIGGIIMIMRENISMTWILAVGCVAIITLILFILKTAFPKFKIIQKLIDKLNLVSRESLTGIMVIRAFGTQKQEEKKFDKANINLTKVNLYINRIMAFMMPAMMFTMNVLMILIVWVGAKQISISNMQVGDMMAFMQYTMQVMMAFIMLSMMFILLPRASVSASRILEVLTTETEIKDPKNPKKFDKTKKGYLEFKNVSFCYDGAKEKVLENINFIAKPGETTAFIGSTGSRKININKFNTKIL